MNTTQEQADWFSQLLENVLIGQGYETKRDGMLGAFRVHIGQGQGDFMIEVTPGD